MKDNIKSIQELSNKLKQNNQTITKIRRKYITKECETIYKNINMKTITKKNLNSKIMDIQKSKWKDYINFIHSIQNYSE